MCPLYTKTFGGKIWNNLHSVSPDNFLGKKFKIAALTISHQKLFEHRLCKKCQEKRCFNLVANWINLSETIYFFKLFARDDVSDENLITPILVCITGQIKSKESGSVPVLNKLYQFWSTKTISTAVLLRTWRNVLVITNLS